MSSAVNRGTEEPAGPDVIVYTDGACSGNPGPGGWAAIIKDPRTGRSLEISGGEPETTNNRMEMFAVTEALRRIKKPSAIHVVTDSRYVVDGMKSWIHNWQKNGWKTSDRKPVKNQDLWQEMLRYSKLHRLTFEWVAGHAGHPENDRCDQLAVAAYQKYLK